MIEDSTFLKIKKYLSYKKSLYNRYESLYSKDRILLGYRVIPVIKDNLANELRPNDYLDPARNSNLELPIISLALDELLATMLYLRYLGRLKFFIVTLTKVVFLRKLILKRIISIASKEGLTKHLKLLIPYEVIASKNKIIKDNLSLLEDFDIRVYDYGFHSLKEPYHELIIKPFTSLEVDDGYYSLDEPALGALEVIKRGTSDA